MSDAVSIILLMVGMWTIGFCIGRVFEVRRLECELEQYRRVLHALLARDLDTSVDPSGLQYHAKVH